MPKRFTETDKWIDPWFCGLTPTQKLTWLFMLDHCGPAGIFQVNNPMLKFHIGAEWDAEPFSGRIIPLSEEKWFIPKFIYFQYGRYSPTSQPHKGVIKSLIEFGLDDFISDWTNRNGGHRGPEGGYKGPQRVALGYRKGSTTLKAKEKATATAQGKAKAKDKATA